MGPPYRAIKTSRSAAGRLATSRTGLCLIAGFMSRSGKADTQAGRLYGECFGRRNELPDVANAPENGAQPV
jgi:hypothetical protein